MFFQRKSIKIISALLIIAAMVTSAIASEPWISYDYDWWWETYPVQSGYVVERVITSNELELTPPLRSPKDLFIYEDDNGNVSIFIVDTDNHRIVITDENFDNVRELKAFTYGDDYRAESFLPQPDSDGNFAQEDVDVYWKEVNKIGTETTLRNPSGIFVGDFRGETRIYIADHNNERVIACDLNGNIWMEYRRPNAEIFGAQSSFRPNKVLADNAGNVYICLTTETRGALVYNEEGVFRGFYGANRVTVGAAARLNFVLRFFMSREMMERRTRPTPVEFSNFTIDDDQFIYTVTETRSAGVDIVKKLNPAGQNVFEEEGKDDWIWGAFMSPYVYGDTYMSLIVDISVDDRGNMLLLDRASGQIFHYDRDGLLMFIYGGRGDQKGLFTAPTAIETHGGKVYVLDSIKNSVTVFKPTEFGDLVLDAMGLFNRGLYTESLEPWQEVLKRDANYYMAYVGMGEAMLSIGEFREALDYFYMHFRGGYGRAFKDFRIHYMRENFDRFLAIGVTAAVILIGTHVAIKIIRKRKTK
jgi:hypothetical protein